MDDIKVRRHNVGNDFVVRRPLIKAPMSKSLEPALALPNGGLSQFEISSQPLPTFTSKPSLGQVSLKNQVLETMHSHTIAAYALILLIVALAGAPIIRQALSSGIKLESLRQTQPINVSSGLNISVPVAKLQSTVQAIISQSATLNLGTKTAAISPSTIKSWLEITPNSTDTKDNIHTSSSIIGSSLTNVANQYVKAPVNQVTVTRSDGTSEVAVAGQNGTQLSDPSSISAQASQISRNLFSNKGFQVNAPLATAPFQAVTAANFSKLIVVDLNSKKMYIYQNGQIINTFLVSAGKPSTPTPVGEFHIWAKLTSQTMTGPGYVQPNVPWVNYFDHSGDAIHGVYWRPASVFGNVNTSHGCVGVPVNIGEWIYNWAPIGTTVITTPN